MELIPWHTHTYSLTHFLLLCLNVAEDQSPQTKKRHLPHSTRTEAMDSPERKQRRLVSLAASEICARVCAFEGFWDCVPWLPGPCAYLSGTAGFMPIFWVFGGRCHCCLICANWVFQR